LFAASRLRICQGLLIASAAGALLMACHKEAPQKPKPAPAAVIKKTPEELEKLGASAREALEGLKPSLGALNEKYKALHAEFDPLPPDLPDFEATRGKFNSADEGLGRMNAKIPWLSAQLDSAIKAGNAAELTEISKSIESSYADIPQANQVAMELLHEVRPFIKMAERREMNQNASCDVAKVEPEAVSKRFSTR